MTQGKKWGKRRAWPLLFAGILLCSVTGCGQKESGIRIEENQSEEPEYLSFFSAESYGQTDIGKYWSDRFAEKYNQNVYINYEGAAYYADNGLSYRELLEKRLESSSPDDLYIINAEDVLEFGKKGYWMDLSGLECLDNLSDAALYQSTYDGKVFSVPLSFNGFGFYWNVSLLQEHGLEVPENLGEFLTLCEALKANGILPYGANKGYGLTVPAMCKGFVKLYGSEEREQIIDSLNSGQVPVSTYMRSGFEFLSLMIEEGYLDPEQALGGTPGKDDIELFVNRKCAFFCGDFSKHYQLKEETTDQIVFTGLPLLDDGCVAVYGASSRLCVNPDSKHLDTALKFIEMVGTQTALDESASQIQTMSSAKDSKIVIPQEIQKMEELLKQPGQIPNQDFELHFNTWESIRDVGRELCRGLSADEACEMLDAMQDTDLKEY